MQAEQIGSRESLEIEMSEQLWIFGARDLESLKGEQLCNFGVLNTVWAGLETEGLLKPIGSRGRGWVALAPLNPFTEEIVCFAAENLRLHWVSPTGGKSLHSEAKPDAR